MIGETEAFAIASPALYIDGRKASYQAGSLCYENGVIRAKVVDMASWQRCCVGQCKGVYGDRLASVTLVIRTVGGQHIRCEYVCSVKSLTATFDTNAHLSFDVEFLVVSASPHTIENPS